MKRIYFILIILTASLLYSIVLQYGMHLPYTQSTFINNNTRILITSLTTLVLMIGLYLVYENKFLIPVFRKELKAILTNKQLPKAITGDKNTYLKGDDWETVYACILNNDHAIKTLGNLRLKDLKIAAQNIDDMPKGPLKQSFSDYLEDLKKWMENDAILNWHNEGINKFSGIFSQTNLSLEDFCDLVISTLTKFVNCNQGAIFLKTSDDQQMEFLTLVAGYAYDKENYGDVKIEKGITLVGQCWLDAQPIFINDPPENYLKISSGLGSASPKCIFLIPLVYNKMVEGVIEMTSFYTIGDREKEFIMKITELISAQIQSRNTNDKIKKLLAQSEEKTHQLLSQEEELRQNTEEITAQREDLERKVNIQKRFIEKLQNSEDSVVINVAGRQRMLSQQMAFYSTMLYHGKTEIKEKLHKTIELFDHSLETLQLGGVFKGVGYDKKVEPTNGEINHLLEEVKKIWEPIHSCLKVLLNTDFSLSQIVLSKEKTFKEIRFVEENITHLLEANHTLTQAYVEESFRWRKKVFDDMELLFIDTLDRRYN